MTAGAKICLILTGFTLMMLLATIDPAGGYCEPASEKGSSGWWEHFRLIPREVIRAVPVMRPGNLTQTPVVPQPPAVEPPPKVRGIYLTSWKAGDRSFVENLAAMMHQTGLNAVVVDVKDDTGSVSYPSQVTLANEIGATARRKYEPESLLELFTSRKIYPIARIVVFKDPMLAQHRNELAVKDRRGGLWKDRHGLCWVDPYRKTVWQYNVALAKEAARLGFKEIQFDYVRFTSDGPMTQCQYPAADERTKADVIRDFLEYARKELRDSGVKVSADIFGLTCSVADDMGIGQVLEEVAGQVDVICPMVYPSHFDRGNYQLADPDAEPYETVLHSLTDACKKVAALDGSKVIIRPWLQDFSLQSVYRASQLRAQVKAVYDAGLEEWIFWNPTNRYVLDKYRFNLELQPQK